MIEIKARRRTEDDVRDEELSQTLRQTYLFADLDPEQLSRVMAGTRLVHLEKGETLFDQGEPAERFYLVRRGQIKLYRLSPEGHEKVIELILPGQTFAEALMFAPGPSRYPVYAQAVEPAELLSFDSAGFRALLHESVDSCFRLMASMSVRLHRQLNEIERLTLQSATVRLVDYLLQAIPNAPAAAPDVRLPASKNLIASRLSIQPETFSRILARLSKEGLIAVHGQHIVLRDVRALRALVNGSL